MMFGAVHVLSKDRPLYFREDIFSNCLWLTKCRLQGNRLLLRCQYGFPDILGCVITHERGIVGQKKSNNTLSEQLDLGHVAVVTRTM